MAQVRALDSAERIAAPTHQLGAADLARRLPNLIIAARQVAATLAHGVHGRRRAGAGETFWQFRPYVMGEATGRIDWRRSARDDHVYVREREWEAAHTVWIWIDRSPSMAFVSSLALQSKLDRALILGLAAADLLVRGGERVGIPGLTRPLAARAIVDRLAEALVEEERRPGYVAAELPPETALAPRAQAVLIGDFLSEPERIATTLRAMSSRGALGHLVAVADPVEESFPFVGHTEFMDADSSARLRLGRAESVRDVYVRRLSAHREALRALCASRGWSFAIHRTDRPASEALLNLRMRLEAADSGGSTSRPGP